MTQHQLRTAILKAVDSPLQADRDALFLEIAPTELPLALDIAIAELREASDQENALKLEIETLESRLRAKGE